MDEIDVAVATPDQARGRRTALALGTLAALAVGIGGFAAGRMSAPADEGAAASAESAASVPAAPSKTPVTDTSGSLAAAATTVAASNSATTEEAKSDTPASPGAQFTAGAWEEPLLQLIGQRTTADGITIRLHRSNGEYTEPVLDEMWPGMDLQGWTPADWCFASASARLSVSTSSAVNLSWVSLYDHPRDGLAIDSFAAGYAEGSPVFGLVVQAPEGTEATMTTGDGRTDTAPIDAGFALLAVQGPIAADVRVDVARPSGNATVELGQLAQPGSSEYREACEPPPPALPEPGQQPDDPAAEEAALRAAIDEVFRWADDPKQDRSAYIEDTTGIAEARDRLLAGSYAENAGTAEITVEAVVFTSPTEAWYRYDLHTSSIEFPNRYGIARKSADGNWQLTRATICQDLALAPGAECEPAVEQVLPPSAENDPRFNPHYYETHPVPGDTVVAVEG